MWLCSSSTRQRETARVKPALCVMLQPLPHTQVPRWELATSRFGVALKRKQCRTYTVLKLEDSCLINRRDYRHAQKLYLKLLFFDIPKTPITIILYISSPPQRLQDQTVMEIIQDLKWDSMWGTSVGFINWARDAAMMQKDMSRSRETSLCASETRLHFPTRQWFLADN